MRRSTAEGLRIAVDALGGLKTVGHLLRPDIHPEIAGQWLAHCLQGAPRREKLSDSQQDYIWDRAFDIGAHEGFKVHAEGRRYRVVEIIDQQQVIDEKTKRAEAQLLAAQQELREVRELTAEQRAYAQATHLKLDP